MRAINFQGSTHFQGGDNLTKIWNTITYEFYRGRRGSLTEEDNNLIEYFISRPKFKDLLNKLVEEEVIQEPEQSYSNHTEVGALYFSKT